MPQPLDIDLSRARLADDSARPYTIYGSPFVASVTLRDGTGGVVAPDPEATYELTVDDDYRFLSDEVMAFGCGSIEGGTAIGFNVDTFTQKYGSVINGRPARRAYWQINARYGTETIVVAQDWLEARGSVSPVDGTATRMQPLVDRAEAAAAAAENAALLAGTAAVSAAQDAVYSQVWAEGTDAQVEARGGTHSAKVWAELAGTGGSGGSPVPTPTEEDNNKVITVSGGTYALSDAITMTSITVGSSTWSSSGITMYGGMADIARLTPGSLFLFCSTGSTVTADVFSNGTATIPFEIPVVSSTSTFLVMRADRAYSWDLTGTTATATLSCVTSPGNERLWGIDIALGTASSVQYDAIKFDTEGSDALTARKVNRCVVRYDGTISRLYCYATEDLA